jgi:hypothetical protein
VTYTAGESTAGTNEETSANGTTNGNHVKMARLHRLVKLQDGTVRLRTTPEGSEVEPIAGHERFLIAPISASMSARVLGLGLDGGMVDTRLLIGRENLFVVHGGQCDSGLL